MNDNFDRQNGTDGRTYRNAVRLILGQDRPLHANNTGRYGVRSGAKAEADVLGISRGAVVHRFDHAVVNVKNFLMRGKVYTLVARWVGLLGEHGYDVAEPVEVKVPSYRYGANAAARAETEAVLVCERPR